MLCPGVAATAGQETGNGAISGIHYNLNLISIKNIDQLPTNDDTNNGNRIFVNSDGRSRIYLQQNFDGIFNVIDYIATRNDPAWFTLPAPENVYDADGNYVSPGAYRVFVRVVGTPGGSGKLSTCGETYDAGTGTTETICLMDNVTQTGTKTPKFTDVTWQLTTVQYDINGDGTIAQNERIDIFDAAFENYLWTYDNNGLKNVQLRFYPIKSFFPVGPVSLHSRWFLRFSRRLFVILCTDYCISAKHERRWRNSEDMSKGRKKSDDFPKIKKIYFPNAKSTR